MLKVEIDSYPMLFRIVGIFQRIVVVACADDCYEYGCPVKETKGSSKNKIDEFVTNTDRVLKINLSQSANELFNKAQEFLGTKDVTSIKTKKIKSCFLKKQFKHILGDVTDEDLKNLEKYQELFKVHSHDADFRDLQTYADMVPYVHQIKLFCSPNTRLYKILCAIEQLRDYVEIENKHVEKLQALEMKSEVMEYLIKTNVLSGILQQFDNYLNESRVLGKEILDGNVCMNSIVSKETKQFLRFTKKLRSIIERCFRNADVREYFKESKKLKVIRDNIYQDIRNLHKLKLNN